MTKKAEIIDISDDDGDLVEIQKKVKKPKVEEDCVVVETIQKPLAVQQKRLLCYGMFDCHIVINDLDKIAAAMVPPNGFMSVKMKLTPQNKPNCSSSIVVEFYHPSLSPKTEDIYGCLTDQVAKLLEYFLRNLLIRIDSYLSPFTKPYAVIRLVIYGDYSTAIPFGNHLRAAGVKLQMPFMQPRQPYFNPQEQITSFRQPQYQPYQFQNTPTFLQNQNTLPEVQHKPESQITELYKSFTSPEDLVEAVQDPKLSSKLFKYQKQALGWMTKRETDDEGHLIFWKKENNLWKNQITQSISKTKPKCSLGGILADDMGLGKTIQIISLILKNYPKSLTDTSTRSALMNQTAREESPVSFGFVPPSEKVKPFEANTNIGIIPSKSTLIICPLSTVFNWEDQIYTHAKKGSLKVLVYHGPNRSTNAGFIAKHDVVITTYNIIALNFVKKGITPLHEIFWHRIVLDEAHIIKSSSTVQAKSAFEFEAKCRWCLTGTPLQNKLDDLYSLIKFLRIEPLDKRSEWSASIIKPINMSRSPRAFARLQILMKAVALRRVKTDVVDGKPILVLPPKTDEVRYLVMNEKERQLYDKVHNSGKAMFESLKASGTVMKNYVSILRAILMMRQACLHPSLVKYQEAHPVVEEDDIVDLDAPMPVSRAESVYKVLSQTDQDVCIFCSNTVEVPGALISPCSHLVCETCAQSLFSIAPNFNGPSSSKSSSFSASAITKVLCPSCNIPITQKNLVEIPESAIVEKEVPDLNFDVDTVGLTYPTKLEALIADLEQVRSNDAATGQRTPTKSVVFSQFTTMLNLCEKPLTEAGFRFVRLDGTMSRNSRSQALADFKSNPKITIFLISIKSGGVGLNLVTASRAYLLEPYWNPAVEQQAIDRIHRLGQTKPVTTIRLIMKDSIEQNMQERQKYKTALAEKAMDDDGLDDEDDTTFKRKRGKLTAEERSNIALEKLQSLMILFK